MKCPPGYIKRTGYTRKGYRRKDGTYVGPSRVPASCIKDVGKKGKGIPVIGKLTEGDLTQYGYHIKEADLGKRRTSLMKAGQKFSPLSVFRKLNALAILNKNTNPTYSKRARADARWVSRNYLGKK